MTTASMNSDRAILPDGLNNERLVLVKACSALRLTFEIRMAAFAARKQGLEFILAVPSNCVLDSDLRAFVQEQFITVLRTESR